jgi:hypothetical protein
MSSPFDRPEIIELDRVLSDSLFNESGRGALLIATSYTEEYLTKLIEEALPVEITINHRNKLFFYPGPLSSLSSKIELAYCFRLIDKEIYECLNALRKIRNDAAHSRSEFALHELTEKLISVYNMGPGVYTLINELSTKFVVKQRIEGVERILIEHGFSEKDKEKKLMELFSSPERIEEVKRAIPFWELRLGVCLLCFLLLDQKDKLAALTKGIRTWGDLDKKS